MFVRLMKQRQIDLWKKEVDYENEILKSWLDTLSHSDIAPVFCFEFVQVQYSMQKMQINK